MKKIPWEAPNFRRPHGQDRHCQYLAGALELESVLVDAGVPVVFLTCFFACFVFTGAGVEGLAAGAGGWSAKDRAAAKAVPNIKLVIRFIFVISCLGLFLLPSI